LNVVPPCSRRVPSRAAASCKTSGTRRDQGNSREEAPLALGAKPARRRERRRHQERAIDIRWEHWRTSGQAVCRDEFGIVTIGNEDGNKDVAPASETASTADDQAFPSLSWTPFDPVVLEGGTLSSLNVEVDDGTRSPQQRFVRDWSTGSQSPKQDAQSRPPFNGRTAARPSLAR
jgi:hypothetical protein